jgi:hypothetical protein
MTIKSLKGIKVEETTDDKSDIRGEIETWSQEDEAYLKLKSVVTPIKKQNDSNMSDFKIDKPFKTEPNSLPLPKQESAPEKSSHGKSGKIDLATDPSLKQDGDTEVLVQMLHV